MRNLNPTVVLTRYLKRSNAKISRKRVYVQLSTYLLRERKNGLLVQCNSFADLAFGSAKSIANTEPNTNARI